MYVLCVFTDREPKVGRQSRIRKPVVSESEDEEESEGWSITMLDKKNSQFMYFIAIVPSNSYL